MPDLRNKTQSTSIATTGKGARGGQQTTTTPVTKQTGTPAKQPSATVPAHSALSSRASGEVTPPTRAHRVIDSSQLLGAGDAPPPHNPPRRHDPMSDPVVELKTISSLFQSEFSKFHAQLDDTKQEILSKISQIESQLADRITCLEIENGQIKSDMEKVLKSNEKLENRINLLECKLQLSERKELENEQYSRKSNVRIYGLPGPTDTEEPKRIVCDFLNSSLKLNPPLAIESVDVAHRVGQKTPRGTQTMLVRLMRHDDKMRVIRQRKSLKNTGRSISEDIAKGYIDYMETLKKNPQLNQVWFFNGKVFCKPNGTEHAFNPRLFTDIDAQIRQTLAKPPRRS